MLIAERVDSDAGADTLAGVCHFGIKTVMLHGETRKVSYVFDLRVDERHRRLGLAKRLMFLVESLSLQAGAVLCYLTVNSTNRNAQSLYNAIGYETLSVRKLSANPLVPVGMVRRWLGLAADRKPLPGGAQLHVCDGRQSREIVARLTHGRGDAMQPADLGAIFDRSHYFVQGFHAQSKTSQAFIATYDSSSLNGVELLRLIVPLSLFSSLVGKACLALAVGALFWLMGSGMMALLGRGGVFGVVLGVALGAVLLVFLLIGVSIVSRWGHTARIRLYAPCFSGPDGPALLRALLVVVQARAERDGYVFSMLNTGRDDAITAALQNLDAKPKKQAKLGADDGGTIFLFKHIGTDTTMEEVPRTIFFDPRDI